MRVLRQILASPALGRVGARTAGLALVFAAAAAAAGAEVVVVVSGESDVTTLREQQITDIFLGRMHRLPDGKPVTPIDQAEGSQVRDEFYSSLTGRSPAQIKAHWAKIIFTGRGEPPRQVADSDAVKDLVAANPAAIGYIDSSSVDDTIRVLRVQ
jgi:ABC-type phosphate transport system substrate-binding protein